MLIVRLASVSLFCIIVLFGLSIFTTPVSYPKVFKLAGVRPGKIISPSVIVLLKKFGVPGLPGAIGLTSEEIFPAVADLTPCIFNPSPFKEASPSNAAKASFAFTSPNGFVLKPETGISTVGHSL